MKNWKKVALTISSYAAVAALAVGGTFAYLSDEESKVNTLTNGDAVDIVINEYQRNDDGSALEEFEQGKVLYPIVGSAQESDTNPMDTWGMPQAENYVDKIVTVKNTGKTDAYVRVFVAIPTALLGDSIEEDSDDVLHWNFGNRVDLDGGYTKAQGDNWKQTWGWAYGDTAADPEFAATVDEQEYIVTTFYYKNALSPEEATTAVMAGLYLDKNVDYDNGVYMRGNDVIEYPLDEGVVVPIFADAVEATGAEGETYKTAFAERDAVEVFKNWADKATGSVVAAPAANAVRPTAYVPAAEGETIESLVVVDDSDADTNLRALYNGESKADYVTGDLIIKNSYLDGTYAMNAYAVNGSGAELIVSNTDLRGWVSYTGFASASFTNCTFDENSNPGIYKTIRPYDTTVITNCDFAEGYEFLYDKLGEGDTVTFVNCTIGGVAITDAAQVSAEGNSAVIIK